MSFRPDVASSMSRQKPEAMSRQKPESRLEPGRSHIQAKVGTPIDHWDRIAIVQRDYW